MYQIMLQFLQFIKLYTEECGVLMKIFTKATGIADFQSTAITCSVIKVVEIFYFVVLAALLIYIVHSTVANVFRKIKKSSKIEIGCTNVQLDSIYICPNLVPMDAHKTIRLNARLI